MKKIIATAIFAIVIACAGLWFGSMHWYGQIKDVNPRITVDIPALTTYRAATDITYCSPGGEDQKLNLYIPENKTKTFPLLVYVHGGGWYAGSKDTQAIADYVAEVARFGYVVAAINYRLVPDHTFPAPIEDTKCAIRYLREHAKEYHIDPSRVGLIGESAGGYLAAMAGTTGGDASAFMTGEYAHQPDDVQAVVNLFGPTTFTGVSAGSKPTAMATAFLGNTDPARANIGPYITAKSPPMLLVHGVADTMVPIQQAEILQAALEDKGVPNQFVRVAYAGHGFAPAGDEAITPSLTTIQNQMIDFLAKYLKR